MVSRTINPLHFEDFEPHRFEDLVRQLAYDYRQWQRLEATGRLGKDDGIDIRGIETVFLINPIDVTDEPGDQLPIDERVWVIQCKRYKQIGPKLVRQIVAEATQDAIEPPYGLIVAAACDVSKQAMDAFRDEARKRGVQEFDLWTKARLEDLLFQPKNDSILFAYFGISLTMRTRSRLTRVRNYLSIKKKLYKALEYKHDHRETKTVLIRDIENDNYPFKEQVPDFDRLKTPPWHLVQVYQINITQLLIVRAKYIGWLSSDSTWDAAVSGPNILMNMLESVMPYDTRNDINWQLQQELQTQVPENERITVEEMWLLPLANVIEVDPEGDILYQTSHLYCQFDGVTGPYRDKWVYGYEPNSWTGWTGLDAQKRKSLFEYKNRTNEE